MIVNISLAMKNAELNCSQRTNGDINNCIKCDIHYIIKPGYLDILWPIVQQNSSIHIIINFLANISALILPLIYYYFILLFNLIEN
jgi:hypothetical protein